MAEPVLLSTHARNIHAGSGTTDFQTHVGSAAFPPAGCAPRKYAPERHAVAWRAVLTSLAGATMWLLFAAQRGLDFEWRPLSDWQGHTWYKIASGSLLAGFVCFQWLLALSRVNRWARAARALYPWHQTAGAFSPVLLFLHSARLGFGYLLVLSTVYMANNVLGLVSPSAFPRLKTLLPFWVIAHIALSVLLAVLVVYHVWTALYYE
jgi:hypothetical protein